jgi:hypothetical protein
MADAPSLHNLSGYEFMEGWAAIMPPAGPFWLTGPLPLLISTPLVPPEVTHVRKPRPRRPRHVQ